MRGTGALAATFERVSASFDRAVKAHDADPAEPSRQDELAHAALEAFEVVVKIVALRSSAMPVLRLKAKALRHLFNAVPGSRPTGVEQQRLCQQIINHLAADTGAPCKSE